MPARRILFIYLFLFVISFGLTAQSNPPAVGSKYRIQPQDTLQFTVYNEPDLDRTLRVEADGSVILPLIGKVFIKDMPISEAQMLIETLYDADYLVNPHVTIQIIDYNIEKVEVVGMVNAPGPVRIPPEEELTLTQAIAAAGSFNLRADRTKVILRRKNDNGKVSTHEFNVKEILRNANASDPVLQDGDTIAVEESPW